jgi:hypothetical protein
MGKAKKKGAAKKADDDLDDLDAILAEEGVDLSKAKEEPKEEPKQASAQAAPSAANGDTAVAKDAAAAFLASQGISVGDKEGEGGGANKKKKKKKKKGGGDDEAAAAPKTEKVCCRHSEL